MVKPFLVLLVLGLSLQAKQKLIAWTKARVVSQDISTTEEGMAAAGSRHVLVARRLNLLHNYVVLETSTAILSLREVFPRDRCLVVPVNGSMSFYRDKDWYIMVDSERRAHRFSLMGLTQKTE